MGPPHSWPNWAHDIYKVLDQLALELPLGHGHRVDWFTCRTMLRECACQEIGPTRSGGIVRVLQKNAEDAVQ
eukprot:6223533-Amphidinium_carterae.1